jgi:hypothetical protein
MIRRFLTRFEAVIRELPDEPTIQACLEAIRNAAVGAAPGQCQGRVKLESSAENYRALREAVTQIRERADARYFGVDLRLDVGDATLAASSDNDVTSFATGLSFGQRFLRAKSTDVMSAVRLRLAARYTEPRHIAHSVLWAVEGGGGMELSRLMLSDQVVQLSAGLDFRYSSSSKPAREQVQPNFTAFRAGFSIPVAGGTALSLGVTAPLTGKISPALTVNFNWGLLLGSASSLFSH